ncbi:hypothetical protein [Paenibacillus sp. FSL A5-0031]|nr:hypothetical protein [Paenibacillus sp. FSL A5-0031]
MFQKQPELQIISAIAGCFFMLPLILISHVRNLYIDFIVVIVNDTKYAN